MEQTVLERTGDLRKANVQLTQEIDERKRAEESLLTKCAEIKRLQARLQAENIYLQHEEARNYNFGQVVGQSKALADVFLRVEQVAPMNATVLLLGATGTGKGVMARAVHSRSTRKNQSMITVDCTSLPCLLYTSDAAD